MNEQEIKLTLSQLKEQFSLRYPEKNEEEIEEMILHMFFDAYVSGKMCREDLETLTIMLGYDVKKDVLDEVERQLQGGESDEHEKMA